MTTARAPKRPLWARAARLLAVVAALWAVVLGGVALWAQSDTRLTAFAQARLDTALPGQLRLGRAHWAWPARLTVGNLTLSNRPDEAPALQVHEAQVALRLWPLVRGQVAVQSLRIDGLELLIDNASDDPRDMGPQMDATPTASPTQARTLSVNIARVLHRLPAIDVAQVQVRRSRIAHVDADSSFDLENISLDGRLHTDGHGQAEADLTVGADDLSWSGPQGPRHADHLVVALQRVQLTAPAQNTAPDAAVHGPHDVGLHGSIGRLSVLAPGLDIEAALDGHLLADDSFDGQVTLATGITLDHPTWQGLLSAPAQSALALTGGLRGACALSVHGSLRMSPVIDGMAAELRLGGNNVGVMHVPFGGLTAQGRYMLGEDGTLDVSAGWDDASLALHLQAQAAASNGGGSGIGQHRVSLVAENIAVAQLVARAQPLAAVVPAWREGLAQAAAIKGLLPRATTVRVLGEGVALFPAPVSRWALEAQATGITDDRVPSQAQPVSLTAAARLDAGGAVLEQLDVALGASRVVLHANGRCGWRADEPAQLRITADSLRLAALLRGSPSPLTASRLRLTLGLSGTPNAPEGKGALQLIAVNLTGAGKKPAQGKTAKGITLGNINVPMNFTGGTLMARGASLAGEALHVGLTGFVQLLGTHNKKLPKHAMGMELRFSSPDVDALLERPKNPLGTRLVRGHLLAGGSLEHPHATADIRTAGPEGSGSAWATMDEAGAALRKLILHPAGGGAMWADGTWRRATDVVALTVGGELPSPTGQHTATLSGSAEGPLQGRVEVRLALETPKSHLLASGEVLPLQQQLDINLATAWSLPELAQWQPAWAAERPTGHINGQVHLRGPFAAPRAVGTLLARGLGLSGRPLGGGRVQASVQTPEDGHYHLQVRAPKAVEADADVYVRDSSGIRIEADIPHFALAALYPPLGVQGADVTGDALINLRLGKRTFAPRGTLTLRHLTATSRGQTMALQEAANIRVDGSNVGVSRMIMSGKPGRLTLEGHVGPVVRASLSGHMALGFVTPFVPALTYARGELSLDLKASGQRQNPQVEAQLQVTQPVVLRPRGLPIEVRLAHGRVTMSPERLAFSQVRGGIEGGSFALGGHVALHNYQPTAFALQLDGHGIPVRQGDLMVEGNVALACVGPGDRPVIQGTIDIVSGRYLRALELRDFSFVGQPVDVRVPTAYQAPWLKNLGLDVHTISHDGVDIAVNASAFAIRARVETDLHITGNALDPKLVGKVQAREGTIAFPRGDLRLSQAAIDFETGRRSAKNPVGAEVTVRAEGEVVSSGTGDQAQAYEIFMNLDGPPESLALDLSSSKELSKLDVLALLSTGNTHLSDLARTGDEAAKLETAEALVGSLLTAPLSRFAQKKIEQVFNVNVDLAIKTGDGAVTVVAAKNINRRIRLEGAYSHGVGLSNTDQSNISTKAQMALTDRLRLEGIAAQSLTGGSQSMSQTGAMQSNLELKYRLLGP